MNNLTGVVCDMSTVRNLTNGGMSTEYLNNKSGFILGFAISDPRSPIYPHWDTAKHNVINIMITHGCHTTE